MTDSKSSRRALAALVLLVLVWGCGWTAMKVVLRYAGPFDFVAMRFLGGAAVLFVISLATRQSLRPPPWRDVVLIGLCQTTGFQALAEWALVGGNAGNMSLLAYTMPFWVVLIAWWLLAERPAPRHWAGIVLAAAGLVCIMRPWRGLGPIHSMLLATGGGVLWALGTVLSKRLFQSAHAPSPLSLTAWQMLVGGVGLGLVALVVPERPIDWTPALIGGLLYTAVMASSLAWLLWMFVVQTLPTHVAGLSSLGVPVAAALIGWLVLSERPGAMETVGIVLMLSGLAVVSGLIYPPRRRPA